jgi:hypothetical protein
VVGQARAITRRPFRIPGGAHETPDGLTLNMQRDFLKILRNSSSGPERKIADCDEV